MRAGLNCIRTMKNLCQRYNSVLGKMEWIMLDEQYDFHQEVARSGFGDMLHDHDRVSDSCSQISLFY